jgi:molecular chaperone DnaJ
MGKDYYKILGVEKSASQDEIKQAFRKLAQQYHPDKAGGDEAKFKEINEAYQVLGKEEKRKQYDQFGATFDQQGGFGGGMNWNDFMRQARGGGFSGGFSAQGGPASGWDFGGLDLGDIFGDIFGFSTGHGQRSRSRRGEDIAVDLQLDFKEAIFGVKKQLRLNRKVACPICNGEGKEPGSNFVTCLECNGRGQVTKMQRTFLGAIQTNIICPKCNGAGKFPEKKCKHCGASGIVNEVQNIDIEIPAGVNDGDTLELRGKGNADLGGAPKGQVGSLYIRIRVKPSRQFEREGNDIFSKQKISVWQAMLGATIDVEVVDATVELKIPEGTQSGTTFRLRGKGVKRGSGRGDHLVEIEVEIPKKLSKKARKLVEEIMETEQ